MQIAIAEAKAQFADLIRRAEAGEEIELTRYGRPVARLTASSRRVNSLIGCAKGQFSVPDDINDGDDQIAGLFRTSSLLPG
ncbi:type II toxin-antitoxin system Phd/YefM family antitoxin [Paracoccus benzoatiresistens]|uniref:Antitoxin n=1 Tax=Paracoccus benzoatiresistens TaxID=2997341 RepID=A0ABT4J2U0_9RHOB|nr:type II toxin-antitoxin system prevent-host-death family antitoxin [Paracoccus sp. EF6]MCZ0960965.1 type II toxin-antitoxin system prevent-host-death family antitoxin [Paracoccus sp. EF6]